MRRFMLGHALCFAIALQVSGASGQDASAQALYDKGARAYREARYEEAIDLFRRAYQIEPHAELVYNLGQAYEKSGDVTRAVESFREYLKMSPNADDRAVVEARIKNLTHKLEASLPKLSVTSTPPGAQLAIDGKSAGVTPWVGPLAAGEHVISVRLSGYRDSERSVALSGPGTTDLDVALEPLGSMSPAPKDDVQDGGASIGLPTWIAFGVGAAALGGALGFELARRGAEDDARNAPTQLEHQDRFADAEGHRDVARVLTGVGAAAVITGGVLLWLDLKSGPVRVGVGSLQAGALGLTGAGCF
jgi:tetratricopeptide (TPR) repeat protein